MKIYKNLTFQVILFIIIGGLFGYILPEYADQYKILSDIFLNLIKLLIGPIIFLTIVLGIGKINSIKKIGRIGGKALVYFEVVSTLCLLLGILIARIIKPGDGFNYSALKKGSVSGFIEQGTKLNWSEYFINLIPSNFFKAFAEGNNVQILIFSILFGIGLISIGDRKQSFIISLETISNIFLNILNVVMRFAPIAAFGGIAYTIGKFGILSILPLFKLIVCFYITLFVFVTVFLYGILSYYKINLFKILYYVRDELFIVVGTASSESALPRIMSKLEKLGCSKSVVGLVMPAGYSFNMDGTAIYLSMAIFFLAQVFKIDLTLQQQISIFGLLMITSKGTAGVFGIGFIILASTLNTINIIPMEGLAILVGIDRFMGEARSLTNLIGNTTATIFIACNEKEFDFAQMEKTIKGSTLPLQ